MMRRCILMLIGVLVLSVFGRAGAQDGDPAITSFTTTSAFVNRSELVNRTARVPVAWTTVERPLGANLVFEQVLPDGSFVNVELPRLFFWVSPNGEGTMAPLLPFADDANEVRLRVRMVNIVDNRVYDTRLIALPIREDNIAPAPSDSPQITSFSAENRNLDRQSLGNRSERVQVSWTSASRPLTATLVFEQVFGDGTYTNIELPRDTPWVNPSDSGVVAPYAPTPQENSVRLRVRMVDIFNGFTYDQRTVTLGVNNPTNVGTPTITAFTTDVSTVSAADLQNRQLTIPVAWAVSNRPDGSNLVFEQVLPSGAIVNVELPRDFVTVPSVGNGYVRPYPVDGANEVLLQLRVVQLSTRQTITAQQTKLNVQDGTTPAYVVVTGDACYQYPFSAGVGIAQGAQAETQRQVTLNNTNGAESNVVRTLNTGETLNIISDPYCYRPFSTNDGVSFRQWQVRTADGTQGWVLEYSGTWNSITRNLALEQADDTVDENDNADDTAVVINSFGVSPNPAQRFGTVGISWDVSGVYNRIDVGWYPSQLWLGDSYRESLYGGNAAQSGVQVELDSMQVDDVRFVIDVFTADGALAATQEVLLDLSCAATLSFTDPDNAGECAMPELQVNAAYQQFENGFMLWRADMDWIVVLYNDGTYRTYDDLWNGQAYTINAPDGFITPQRGFGYVWVNNTEIQNRLGYATGDEVSFNMKAQQADKRGSRGTMIGEWYYAIPNGRSIRTQSGTTGNWKQL